MLDVAIKYKEQLEELQYNIWFNDKYKFWNDDTYYDAMTIDDSTWGRHQFVSIKNNEIIGYISYSVNRRCNYAHSLSIMNFTDDKMTFGFLFLYFCIAPALHGVCGYLLKIKGDKFISFPALCV